MLRTNQSALQPKPVFSICKYTSSHKHTSILGTYIRMYVYERRLRNGRMRQRHLSLPPPLIAVVVVAVTAACQFQEPGQGYVAGRTTLLLFIKLTTRMRADCAASFSLRLRLSQTLISAVCYLLTAYLCMLLASKLWPLIVHFTAC